MINFFKYICYTPVVSLCMIQQTLGFGKNDIIPQGESIVSTSSLPGGTWFLDGIADYIKDTIFGILVIIVIGMFLYIGFKLIIARWQAEEFSKAMKSLVYVVVWLFVISIAWTAVRLISSITLN